MVDECGHVCGTSDVVEKTLLEDINKELDVMFVSDEQRNKTREEIKENEMFINREYERINIIKLKQLLSLELKQEIRTELETFKTALLRKFKDELQENQNQKKSQEYQNHDRLVNFMTYEIDFLRKQVLEKDRIIKDLAMKSLMRGEVGESVQLEAQKSIPQGWDLKRNVLNDQSLTDESITQHNKSSKFDLKDQLRFTEEKCKENINTNTQQTIRVNKEQKSVVEETIDFDVKENDKVVSESNVCWNSGTTLITGDSMLVGIDEKGISPNNDVKVRSFPGAKVEDMTDYIKPLLKKRPDRIILHVGTNNTKDESSRSILEKMLLIKDVINTALPACQVIISNIVKRNDDAKAKVTITNLNKHLEELNLDIINNGNIDSDCLGKKGLHLNKKGNGKLAVNFIRGIRLYSKK